MATLRVIGVILLILAALGAGIYGLTQIKWPTYTTCRLNNREVVVSIDEEGQLQARWMDGKK